LKGGAQGLGMMGEHHWRRLKSKRKNRIWRTTIPKVKIKSHAKLLPLNTF
jgi:hypothetical protein